MRRIGFAGLALLAASGTAGHAAEFNVESALRDVRAHAAEFGVDPAFMGMAGGAAGGQLAVLLGSSNGEAALEGSEGEPEASSEVAAVVDIDGLADKPDPAAVRAAMRRVFQYQLAHPLPIVAGSADRPQGWLNATFYTGVMAAWRATGEAAYRDAAEKWAEAARWAPGPRPRFADDQCCAQTYLELFLAEGGPEKIAAFRRNVDAMIADPKPGRVDWWWCDALYMAPPAFARLARATGDARYRELLHRMYWDTVEFLHDPSESLFYRDATFLPGRPGAEGRKIFWSRGNGWVFAGLTRVIDFLPADDPFRPRYVDLFKRMAARLLAVQQPDGFWRSDLLAPDRFPGPESSGTAFFAMGFAWGVNQGLLDRAEFSPAVLRGWRALNTAVDADGRLGYVQPVGFKPGPAGPDDTKPYAAGAYLLLGSQLLSDTRSGPHEN